MKQILIVSCLFTSIISHSQDRGKDTKLLDSLINKKEFVKADAVLKSTISKLTAKKDYYYLADWVFYVGKLKLEQNQNKVVATKAVTDFINLVSKATDSAKVLRQIQMTTSTFYQMIGEYQNAYDANINALNFTKKWKEAKGEDFGIIENNLSTFSNFLGNIQEGKLHAQKAMQYFESDPKSDPKNLYNSYNSLAVSMWKVSKVDSALYYYKKYETLLNTLEKTPENIFGQAYLQNNMAAIYSSQGNLEQGLKAMETTINCLNTFINSDVSAKRKEQARTFRFNAIENYALLTKQSGDYQKALDLYLFNYKEEQKNLGANHALLFETKIKLGQIYLDLNNYDKANYYLDDAILQISNTEGDNYLYDADAHFAKAMVCNALKNTKEAKQNFEAAERLYELGLEGSYDDVYMSMIETASHFYAKNNERERALQMSEKAYDYIKKNQGVTSSFEIQQTLNLGEIYYELEDYQTALQKSETTINLLKTTLPTQTKQKDSTVIYKYYPSAVLLNTKANYQLHPKKEVTFLKQQLEELDSTITIIEQQKSHLGDDTNISVLIEVSTPVFEFAKKLSMELYELTKDKKYLNKVISLNESVLYNKIRSQLNSRASMAFRDVPETVLEKEKSIKKAMSEALTSETQMDTYFKLETDWKAYLADLKSNYPNYYKLKFAPITKSLKNIEAKVPTNTTIVRYTYIDNQLYAIVISKENMQSFKLNQEHVTENIAKFQNASTLFDNQFESLSTLYNQLWKPFEAAITTKNVIIIPDRDLFNLSFEMLTPKPISSYKDMATNSLLSKYIISYNYSLFLIDKGSKITDYKNNFVAFAPEFNDKMKQNYKVEIKDSMSIDKTYLTLLPQPFTKSLAQSSTRLFKGTSFLNEKSTKHIFENAAKEHKIIHIGTHAESNNVSPELSRLVFAKSADSLDSDDNYLYTYEIYNTNLSSNLAILTACETGKPSYQAGEGMISLANAFNYAGSESILTSLWKIDEQSSAKIVDLFYNNIKKGFPKDKALQQAKLTYISKAEGRTINPEYWAGLVLIGNTTPIQMTSSPNLVYWVFGILLLVFTIFIYRRTVLKKQRQTH
ncbi:MAG: CHAT domain-containing protein [Gelidibacter sp.]|nr:CHAT domain-containing protein [Gelidibacter sp.]